MRRTSSVGGGSSLVFTGVEYGVSWGHYGSGVSDIYFARISTGGTKIGSDARITDAPEGSAYPSLVYKGDMYGVTWQDFRDGNNEIYFALIACD